MRELTKDPFYKLIKDYKRCIIDYCLMEDDTPYQGYQSHKDAVLFAMHKVIERNIDFQLAWNFDIERARAERINTDSLLYAPKRIGKDSCGNPQYDCKMPDTIGGEQIPYWYAFWNPPHGTGYGPKEFDTVNAVLFPLGTESLEVYEWTTDWSDYFDAGHEWWGTACWSVYDNRLNRFVVILASTTD